MTIASEVTKLNTNLTNSYTAVSGKGGTLPLAQNFDNLATAISSIPSGTTPVITSLNVTPTTSAQTITAPSGTDGYSPINVSAVTSSIDNNITAGNIKSGVSILGVTGTYSGTTPTGTLSITANGVYDVTNYASADVSVSGGGDSVYMYFYMQDPMSGAASIDNPIKVGSKCYMVDGYAETGIDFSSPMTVISVGTYSFNTDDGGFFPTSYSNLYQLR